MKGGKSLWKGGGSYRQPQCTCFQCLIIGKEWTYLKKMTSYHMSELAYDWVFPTSVGIGLYVGEEAICSCLFQTETGFLSIRVL